jgi:hypothetical protein
VIELLLLVRQLDAIVVVASAHGAEHRRDRFGAELVAESAADRVLAHPVAEVVLDASWRMAATTARRPADSGQDDGGVRRRGEVRQAGPLADLLVVVLRRVRERVVDAVRITDGRHGILDGTTGRTRAGNIPSTRRRSNAARVTNPSQRTVDAAVKRRSSLYHRKGRNVARKTPRAVGTKLPFRHACRSCRGSPIQARPREAPSLVALVAALPMALATPRARRLRRPARGDAILRRSCRSSSREQVQPQELRRSQLTAKARTRGDDGAGPHVPARRIA